MSVNLNEYIDVIKTRGKFVRHVTSEGILSLCCYNLFLCWWWSGDPKCVSLPVTYYLLWYPINGQVRWINSPANHSSMSQFKWNKTPLVIAYCYCLQNSGIICRMIQRALDFIVVFWRFNDWQSGDTATAKSVQIQSRLLTF